MLSLKNALTVGQVALAVVVVVSAGLLVRSLALLHTVDFGFNQERLLVFQTALPPQALPDRAQQMALQEEMVARVTALPDVAGVAALPKPPFSAQGGWTTMYAGEGQTPEAQQTNPWVNFEVVGPEYFRTLEIPIYRGRAFQEHDREDADRVAIISRAVAQHGWPGEDPIGKRIKLGPYDSPAEWHTVVGVVGETRYRELAVPQPSLYLPARQFGGPVPMSLAVRTHGETAGLVPQIRSALTELHPELMLVSGGSVRELTAAPLARPRFGAVLLSAFATLTLLLAVAGVYGAVAATVLQRTRELGVRLALGATAAEVRALVLRLGMRLAILGCALGIIAAFVGTRSLQSMLFGITPTDPVTFATVALIVLGVAALACYLPARRASRVDPVDVLRAGYPALTARPPALPETPPD
jgi:putative ABC transport system permease protein